MKLVDFGIAKAADVASMVVLPARGGLARVASRTVDVAMDLTDRLRAGQDGRARESLASLQNCLGILSRLDALAEADARRLLARCEEVERLLGGHPAYLAFDRPTDCSPSFLDDEDE